MPDQGQTNTIPPPQTGRNKGEWPLFSKKANWGAFALTGCNAGVTAQKTRLVLNFGLAKGGLSGDTG